MEILYLHFRKQRVPHDVLVNEKGKGGVNAHFRGSGVNGTHGPGGQAMGYYQGHVATK